MYCGGRKRFKHISTHQNQTPVLIERFIEPCVLLLLTKAPAHGYTLIQELKKSCLCTTVDTGNFYRILKKLQREEMIQAEKKSDDKRRISYAITPKGKTFLTGWTQSLEKNKELITLFLKKYQEQAYV